MALKLCINYVQTCLTPFSQPLSFKHGIFTPEDRNKDGMVSGDRYRMEAESSVFKMCFFVSFGK